MSETMTEIQINGERAYLYKIGIGSHSERSEEWYYHRECFSEVEIIEALLKVLPAEEAKEAERQERRNEYAQRVFGCDANQLRWCYAKEQGQHTGPRAPLPDSPRGNSRDLVEWFSSDLASGSWSPLRLCLKAAGFVELEPTEYWDTDEPRGYVPGAYAEQLRREIEEAKANNAKRLKPPGRA